MTDIETIKATVRSRLTTRLAPPANPIGAPFDHGDYIIEELAGDLIGFTRVNAFYDPSIGLPQDPSELDRYIATATANGWTKNNIYTYLDGTWHETNFEPGLTFPYIIAEDNYYGAYPAGWQELSIGGIDDYVTLTTDQNVTGKKTFSQGIGIGTTDPQSMIHINLPYEDWMGGIQISNGFADESDGVTINLAGADALYGVSYTGRHIFNIETRPGVWETGLVIEDTPVNGPAVTTPQIVVGEPTGSDMGAGSLNAESVYVNGEPVVTGTFDIDDYVTIATDQNITGQKSFTKKIGIGTTNPQRLLHLNTDNSSRIGIGLGRYGDVDNYLTIDLDGNNASYNIGYSGSHVFEVETSPGESEIGLWITDYHNGPVVQAYQLVAGNPYGWGMGVGSINAEALYVEGEPVVTGTFDIDDYVTLTTDQNISGQKTFDQAIGVGTTNPQNLLHIDGSSSPGLQISNGFSDGDDGLSINLESDAAVYSVDYNRVHMFRLETSPGVWKTGLTIEDTPSHGPICNMPMVNIGDPTGGNMGIGSLNAEALYVNGEPVVTGTFDSSDYYTKTDLQTSGQSSVHAGNITNVPWLTSLPSHDHDTRYYTKTNLQTSGGSSVHWDNLTNKPSTFPHASHGDTHAPGLPDAVFPTGTEGFLHYGDGITANPSWQWRYPTWSEITNKPSTFPHAKHASSHLPDESDAVFPSAESWGYLVYSPSDNFMEWRRPSWGDISGDQSGINVSGFNNDAGYLTGNPFDQDLNTTDRVKFDGVINQNAGVSSCHYRSVASKEIRSSSSTGTMKITMPQSWSSTMITIRIRGYNYSSATGWWECIVSGYNYTTEQWYYPKCELRGNPPFTDVRLAHDGTKCCLLLGNTSTIWNWPKIHITDVITGHDNYSDWSSGWSIDLITDESGISNIATPDVDRPWHSGNLDPSDYALVSHNHSASDINSGTLSNSRLSFNPDYFVQGENSSRAITYSISNPFDGTNNVSTFFRLDDDEDSNPDGLEYYYGFRCVNPNHDGYTTEIAGRANAGKLWFGGLIGDVRQPWREIHHSGVNYIKYDNNPAEVSHPTTSENLGTSNQTLNPTKGIYYAPGRSDTQEITMGNSQYPGQTVEILHNGLQPLRVFCGPGNPPLMINVPEYSILRLRMVYTPVYIGWSPVI